MLFSVWLRQRYTAHILLMAPPIKCYLGYWFRTLNPNPILNPNLNRNPKTDPNPKSNNNLCSAKRHPNKVQDSVINYYTQWLCPRKFPGAKAVNLLCPRITYIFFGKTQCLFSRPSCTVNTCRLFSR